MMDDAWNKGVEVFDAVYGPGSSEMVKGLEDSMYVGETVRHLFGDIWALPNLSTRDKRLLVIGATTMLGRSDLIAVQVAGAIVNEELNDAQLEEIKMLMLFYAGAGNTTALQQGFALAKERAKGMQGK
ncbi:MAG: hypothetical protein JWR77_52 [Rhizorhabdus sp.]|nr:hypothetical protein [Rhizorhabdus sp.]